MKELIEPEKLYFRPQFVDCKMMQDMGSGEGGGETQAALEQFWPKVSKNGRIYGRPRRAE